MSTEQKFSDEITLQDPIKRGSETIASVKLRRPKSGDFRGLSLMKIQIQDVAAISSVLTRISVPSLAPDEIDDLDLIDFTALSAEVLGFLFTQEQIASVTN